MKKYNNTEFVNKDGEEMIICAECGRECFLTEEGFYECGTCGHDGYIGEEVFEGEYLFGNYLDD